MIYPDVDPIKFGRKHGIMPDKHVCLSCSQEVNVNIPIISKDLVGFESEKHGCHDRYKIILFILRNEEWLKQLYEQE